jgi:hypothetical protein
VQNEAGLGITHILDAVPILKVAIAIGAVEMIFLLMSVALFGGIEAVVAVIVSLTVPKDGLVTRGIAMLVPGAEACLEYLSAGRALGEGHSEGGEQAKLANQEDDRTKECNAACKTRSICDALCSGSLDRKEAKLSGGAVPAAYPNASTLLAVCTVQLPVSETFRLP